MNQLKAKFLCTSDMMELGHIRRMAMYGETLSFVVNPVDDDCHCEVIGSNKDIMFLIAAVISDQQDYLLSVEPYTSDPYASPVQCEIDGRKVKNYVTGACFHYLAETGQADILTDAARFSMFTFDRVSRVQAYLRGERKLDSRCSDFDCNLALDAEKLFKGQK